VVCDGKSGLYEEFSARTFLRQNTTPHSSDANNGTYLGCFGGRSECENADTRLWAWFGWVLEEIVTTTRGGGIRTIK
jgi:hypothetical protein